MGFEVGTVVWVKLQGGGRLWWVGEVTDEYPEDLLARHRTVPIAVVKFYSNADEFAVVKKEAEILLYNCDKREDFIKKGKQQKDKGQLEKFIADCKHAESLTGGKADEVDTVESAHSAPKRPVYAELFKQTPPPPQKSAHEISGLVKLNFRKSGSPSKKGPTPQLVEGKRYKCDQCGFSCDRVNVLTSHRKTHNASSSASGPSTPTKTKSPAKAASEATPKKPGSPTKSAPGRRGRKRKAGKELVPPAADKQQILADWSDTEGDNPESPNPLVEDREPKKPRTDKELSDAFESLLKTTKPSEAVSVGSPQEPLKSDLDDRSDDDEFFVSAHEDLGGEETFKIEYPGEEPVSTSVEAAPEVNSESSVLTSAETLEQNLEEKVEAPELETETIEDPHPEPVPKSNPTAKVIGVCKVVQSPTEVKEDAETKKDQDKEGGIDDAEELQNEVDALLAATLPVELNHEQLFATRPDLQYIVSPVQLKSEGSPPASLGPTSPTPTTATQPIPSSPPRARKSQPPPPLSPMKSQMADTVPNLPITMAQVHPVPQPTAITLTQAVAIKSHPPGKVLLKTEAGVPGALKITKAPPPTFVKEKIVVIHPEGGGSSSPSKGVQQQQQQGITPIMTPQAVKLYSTYPVTSASSLTPIKKGRAAKKQTLTERAGVMQLQSVSPTTLSQGKLTPLTPSQLIASSTTLQANSPKVQTVQSLQTKVSALPTVAGGLRGTTTTGTGMVRIQTTASQLHMQQQRAASPAILTKPAGGQLKYQRQQVSLPLLGPSTASSSQAHYQVVTSTGEGQGGNDLILISQPSQPQQRFVLSSASGAGASPASHLMSAAQRKRAPIKKAVPGPALVKLPEVAKPLPKPTAAVKPCTATEEEKLNSAKNAKIRQALIAGQKTEKIKAAEKVVHLLPIQNQDGTVTYMMVHMDDAGSGVRIDQGEGPGIQEGDVEPLFMESDVNADKMLATIIHQNSKPYGTTPKKTPNRKSPAPKGPATPRGKSPHTLVIPSDQVQLQKQSVQPRQAVIGQQQQVEKSRPTTSQHLHHPLAQTPKQTPSYHVVPQQSTIGQQPTQRQVFYAQQQQPVSAQSETSMVVDQGQQGVQVQAALPTPITFAAETTPHVQHPLQDTKQQEQFVQVQQAEEPQMPALVETKAAEATTTQIELAQQQLETQQIQYVIQHQEGDGTVAVAGQEMNVEVPMEMQDYFQIVTGEDGIQYYVAPEGMTMAGDASQGYYQIQTAEGEAAAVNYEYPSMEGEQQYLILQEDGTLVSPQSLGMDISQVLALQQQAQMEGQEQQQFTEQVEGHVQLQDPNQPNV